MLPTKYNFKNQIKEEWVFDVGSLRFFEVPIK